MTLHPSVLIGLSARDAGREVLGERVAAWVRRLGYEPTLSEDGAETLRWVRECAFAATLLDSRLAADTGERIWRTVRPIAGRRLVLMAREPRTDLWFEALRAGVGAVLAVPPSEAAVRAALRAETGAARSGAPWRG